MNSIGIDLGGTNIAAGIVDTNGTILIKQSVPTKAARPREEILSDIASLCHNILQKSGETLSDIRLIGLAVPGGVDPGKRSDPVYTEYPVFGHQCMCDPIGYAGRHPCKACKRRQRCRPGRSAGRRGERCRKRRDDYTWNRHRRRRNPARENLHRI